MRYAQQLKNPKWQRKRLEIMQRDDFKCVRCGFNDRTLHVHHKDYIYGFKAWEYPEIMLETLCDICHYFEHAKAATTF